VGPGFGLRVQGTSLAALPARLIALANAANLRIAMLSYQHEYHAGNHADVLKHAVFVRVLLALLQKDKPLRVFDAHAGSGLYDLGSREARRHAEHEGGIAKVLAAAAPPPALAAYLEAVRACNGGTGLRCYPGSPWLARSLLRPADQLVLMELHPRAIEALRHRYGRDPQVHVHARDCFEGLPALLPPPERRGLVLIDPPYEVKDDYARVVDLLAACHRRWPAGTYLLWYPLLRGQRGERLPARVAAQGIRRIYRLELEVEGRGFAGMRGSGLLAVNPPYGLDAELEVLADWLWRVLAAAGRGGARAGWLVPE